MKEKCTFIIEGSNLNFWNSIKIIINEIEVNQINIYKEDKLVLYEYVNYSKYLHILNFYRKYTLKGIISYYCLKYVVSIVDNTTIQELPKIYKSYGIKKLKKENGYKKYQNTLPKFAKLKKGF